MSKYVKNLLVQDIARRLSGVDDVLLVNVVGLSVNQSVQLRKQLREKNIELMVIKNSLAKRAAAGTSLSSALEIAEGSLALVWGQDDIISIAKEVVRLDHDSELDAFKARGGVMDGEPLTAEGVIEISKWPSRGEQLSIVVGQILAPGANLSAAMLGPARTVAGQIKQKPEDEDET